MRCTFNNNPSFYPTSSNGLTSVSNPLFMTQTPPRMQMYPANAPLIHPYQNIVTSAGPIHTQRQPNDFQTSNQNDILQQFQLQSFAHHHHHHKFQQQQDHNYQQHQQQSFGQHNHYHHRHYGNIPVNEKSPKQVIMPNGGRDLITANTTQQSYSNLMGPENAVGKSLAQNEMSQKAGISPNTSLNQSKRSRLPPPTPPPRSGSWVGKSSSGPNKQQTSHDTHINTVSQSDNKGQMSQVAMSNRDGQDIVSLANDLIPTRYELFNALLTLLIWHHPDAGCTDISQTDLNVVQTFVLKWICHPTHEAVPQPEATLQVVAKRLLGRLIRILYSDPAVWESGVDEIEPNEEEELLDQESSVLLPVEFMERSEQADSKSLDDNCQADLDVAEMISKSKLDNDLAQMLNASANQLLPPNTSLIELKSVALQAIQRLALLCQPEHSLHERDMNIVQLLNAIHLYTLVHQAKPKHLSSIRCPVAEVAALVRLSFESTHRSAICELGGVHALISLLRTEQTLWLSKGPSPSGNAFETSLALRRYVCMALTNLTYGAAENKAMICRRLANLEALLVQLELGNEELKQVSASVLRNLSWRTDVRSKAALRRVCAAKRLTLASMSSQRDITLRTTLSTLWNLSAHCLQNKRAVCSVDGVFPFLLHLLNDQNIGQNLVIIENSGGILRNISTVIAMREDYRTLLRQFNGYQILLNLLHQSPSLTVIVNVCGTLWNLTCATSNPDHTCHIPDRHLLVQLGALDVIEKLTQSNHDLIRSSSLAVFRNLLNPSDPTHFAVDTSLPSQRDDEDDVGHTGTVCTKRSVNPRARLRFGLLSVVFEAETDDELTDDGVDDDDDGDDNDENDDNEVDEGEEEERMRVSNEQSDAYRPSVDCLWSSPGLVDHDDQTCVYAEEGTPFSSNSAKHSHSDLRNLTESPSTYSSLMYTRGDHASHRSSVDRNYGDVEEEDEDEDECVYLPSPPEDVSNLVSPLNTSSLNLIDEPQDTNGVGHSFPMPPPPPPPQPPLVDHLYTSSKQSPLVYSRGTSSYISSIDLAICESNPESPHSSVSCRRKSSDSEFDLSASQHQDEEVKLTFAEEGTPLDAISLKEDNQIASNHNDDEDDDDDEDEDDNEDILQQCIQSAMPSLSTTHYSSIPTSTHHHHHHHVMHHKHYIPYFHHHHHHHHHHDLELVDDDSLKSFAVEDTPFESSTKASSLSDLVPAKQDVPTVDSNRQSSSGSSLFNGPDLLSSSDLLTEVIQSAMPPPKVSYANRCHIEPSANDNSNNNNNGDDDNDDCLHNYAVEGTPLTVDDNLSPLSQSNLRLIDCGKAVIIDDVQERLPSGLGNGAGLRPKATVAPMPTTNYSSVLANHLDLYKDDRHHQSLTKHTPQLLNHTSNDSSKKNLFNSDKAPEDTSSFSSLLSIESVGLEHSLLQECISSAMPRPKPIATSNSKSQPTSRLHKPQIGLGASCGTYSQPQCTLPRDLCGKNGNKPKKSMNFLGAGSRNVTSSALSRTVVYPADVQSATTTDSQTSANAPLSGLRAPTKLAKPKTYIQHPVSTLKNQKTSLSGNGIHLISGLEQEQLIANGVENVIAKLMVTNKNSNSQVKNAAASSQSLSDIKPKVSQPVKVTTQNGCLSYKDSKLHQKSTTKPTTKPVGGGMKSSVEATVTQTSNGRYLKPGTLKYQSKGAYQKSIETPPTLSKSSRLPSSSLNIHRGRSAMTAPSSAVNRSLAASRSNSAAGSVTNLPATAHQLSFDSVSQALAKHEQRKNPVGALKSQMPIYAKTKAVSSCQVNGEVQAGPKTVRGGRKSLTGRKAQGPMEPPKSLAIRRPVSAVKPTLHTNDPVSTHVATLKDDGDRRHDDTTSKTVHLNGMWIVRDNGVQGLI